MSTNKSSLKVIHYSPKCVVLVGDTSNCKEDMKTMGGKWNSRLTNKETGEKFGGWIFMKSREEDLKKWLSTGVATKFEFNSEYSRDKDRTSLNVKMLISRVEELEKTVAMLVSKLSNEGDEVVIESSDEEEEESRPMKRLLR